MPAIMFSSSFSFSSSSSSSSALLHPKHAPRHLIVQIIQLVEAPPPPPPRPLSRRSSSCSCTSSSGPSTSDSDEDGSSFCSSIITPDEASREPIPWTDDTYTTRMKRVHAWRDGFGALSESRMTSLKRKTSPQQADDDTVSHTSKRSRSHEGHPCPACDTLFPSLSSLREHGGAPDIPEACRVAVEYNFE